MTKFLNILRWINTVDPAESRTLLLIREGKQEFCGGKTIYNIRLDMDG
jgi:hypothetical protein